MPPSARSPERAPSGTPELRAARAQACAAHRSLTVMRPSLLPLLASACFGFGFVQPPRVGPAASRPAHRSFGRASLRLMGKDLNRDELFAMMQQQQPQGRPGRPGRPAQRAPSKPPMRSEPASTQPDVAVGAMLQLPVPRIVEVSGVAGGAPSASSLESLRPAAASSCCWSRARVR